WPWRGIRPISPRAGRGPRAVAAGGSAAVCGARGGIRRAHRAPGKLRQAVKQGGRDLLGACRRTVEQPQDAAYESQRRGDPWRTLCEGPEAPPGGASGLLCALYLYISRSRIIFPAAPGEPQAIRK